MVRGAPGTATSELTVVRCARLFPRWLAYVNAPFTPPDSSKALLLGDNLANPRRACRYPLLLSTKGNRLHPADRSLLKSVGLPRSSCRGRSGSRGIGVHGSGRPGVWGSRDLPHLRSPSRHWLRLDSMPASARPIFRSYFPFGVTSSYGVE